ARLVSPGPDHLLGTDQLGRDLAGRVLSGFAWSLGIGAVATLLAMVIGITIGILGGWYPGVVRAVLNRVIDIGISFPFLVVAVTVVAVVGRGFWPLALTLGVVSWPTVARVVYAETLGLREREYVVAARLIGVRSPRSILTHLLPALRPTLQVIAAFTFADLLVAESGLSFLGLGAPLGDATWGNMLADSRAYLVSAPWMMLVPATVIVLAVLSANLLGDGLSAQDRLRNRRETSA
ncbi:MAG TPA: ABC transporter permease, partial [Candidatus Nocardiopsis merdipullorum]|nr:ABC transporter permease [Candidatus Nocardiopsis merdipullorum]